MRPFFRCLIGAMCGIVLHSPFLSAAEPAVPILVYHRFGPVRADSMTVTTQHFKEQMDLLCKNNISVIPLADFVAWRLGKGPAPPSRSIVLTFDDGHVSVYREARAIIKKNRIPVTLFIYPSCISHASYAMTWEQLSELAATPFFTVESHTFWHPNFKQARQPSRAWSTHTRNRQAPAQALPGDYLGASKKLDHAAYSAFVDMQLQRSRSILEQKLRRPVNVLAWPFGIYDPYLMARASAAGYEAGFSIDCRAATASDPVMALPRCLVSDDDVGSRFLRFIESAIRSARN